MQYISEEKIGVSLRKTPKCHPEIAGQGIEYAWGYAKLRLCKEFNDAQASISESTWTRCGNTSAYT